MEQLVQLYDLLRDPSGAHAEEATSLLMQSYQDFGCFDALMGILVSHQPIIIKRYAISGL